ncbi:MAG TPA: 4Fe-4S dicluster domain-containing protein [Thermodesulfobacteriaceae bacterium]|nr:4Fe-4S dicluster domain-containing protein [Thermodesulfobacteriaceae bacterium]
MVVANYITDIFKGSLSLLKGMKVTWSAMISRQHTFQWPREMAPIAPAFRGHIKLVAAPKTGFPKCFACMTCSRNCPSKCITIKGQKPPGKKKKAPLVFRLDFTKCSLCGLCVESCPVGALEFSREYSLAAFDKDNFSAMDLTSGLKSPFQET